jgi:mRNA interferase RelE/StbE
MSKYTIYITPDTFQNIKQLPANIRQRVRTAIRELADNPHPSQSKRLDFPEFEGELWRLRLDNWRIIYQITEVDNAIDVLAVRKRPPYDYGDLENLLQGLN